MSNAGKHIQDLKKVMHAEKDGRIRCRVMTVLGIFSRHFDCYRRLADMDPRTVQEWVARLNHGTDSLWNTSGRRNKQRTRHQENKKLAEKL